MKKELIPPLLQLRDIPEHGLGVFGPKNKEIHIRGKQGNFTCPAIVEVDGIAKTSSNSVHEPLAVKGRNICPSAGADYHWHHLLEHIWLELFAKQCGLFPLHP